jgi:hypothetical protein
METFVGVVVATAAFAGLMLVYLRGWREHDDSLDPMHELQVEAWENVRSFDDHANAKLADLIAVSRNGRRHRFDQLGVDESWMYRLVGTNIHAEIVDDTIVRMRTDWESSELLSITVMNWGMTSEVDEDRVVGEVDGLWTSLVSLGDWLSADVAVESNDESESGRVAGFHIELELTGSDHQPLYGDERQHGDLLVRLVEGSERDYRDVVVARLAEWRALLDSVNAQLILQPDTATYCMNAVPSEALGQVVVDRAHAAARLIREANQSRSNKS